MTQVNGFHLSDHLVLSLSVQLSVSSVTEERVRYDRNSVGLDVGNSG